MCLKEENKQKLKEEVPYYAGLPGQFEDDEAMYHKNIWTHSEEQETDQYNSEDSSDVFIGPVTEGDFS